METVRARHRDREGPPKLPGIYGGWDAEGDFDSSCWVYMEGTRICCLDPSLNLSFWVFGFVVRVFTLGCLFDLSF